MPQKVYHVQLSGRDRRQLESYVNHGQRAARAVTRAGILLLADEHYADEEIREVLGVSRPTVAKRRRKYHEQKGGPVLELLQEATRPGQPVKLDSRLAAQVAGIACSEAPLGAARWTLELIADRLVELNLVDTISRESVRQMLKKTPSSPGSSSGGVEGRLRESICGIWKTSWINTLVPMIRASRGSVMMSGPVNCSVTC